MPAVEKDISFLLNSSSNVTFVETCYDTLLARAMTLYEIKNALKLLTGGLPKEAFIYWIIQSNEFGNRFAIKNLQHYKNCYFHFLSRQPQPILHRLLVSLSGKYQLEMLDYIQRPIETSNDFADIPVEASLPPSTPMSNFEEEYSALSLSQISQIPQVLETVISDGQCTTAGHLAADLLPPNIKLPISSISTLNGLYELISTDNIFITNPVMVYGLINASCLQAIARAVKNAVIFTMPSLPIFSEQIGFIWDANWDAPELEPDGSYCRWFHGNANIGRLTLFNNSSYYKKIALNFTLSSPEENAEVFISFQNTSVKFSFKRTEVHSSLTLYLKPGENHLVFTYIGQGIIPSSQETRMIKYSVNGLTANEFTVPFNTYSQQQTYSLDEKSLGSGYYPYCIYENSLRSTLHQAGFFEIEAFHIPHSGHALSKKTSRYNYSKELMNRDCFYYTSNNCQESETTSSGIDIYIAHRTGTLNS